MKMLIALVLFLQAQSLGGDAGVARSISRANNKFNIVGGETINITDAPYQVSIFIQGIAFCTGVLIAPDVVISSGHCLREKEGFCGFQKKLPLSDRIGTIEMLKQGEEIADGESVFVSGWGTESDDGDYTVYLHRAEVYTSNVTRCTALYRQVHATLTPRSMCTLKEGSGFCRDEWGAPLVYNGKLAGIATAFINKCGNAKFPQLSAKVSSIRDWIDEALKNNTIID